MNVAQAARRPGRGLVRVDGRRFRSSSRTRSRTRWPPTSAAALRRTEAIQPAETLMPASSHSSSVARVDRDVVARGPGSRPARAPPGRSSPGPARGAAVSPSVTVPQHGHCLACATYSVTRGAGAGLNVGDLVAALCGDRLARQALTAAAALRGRVEEPLVRVLHQPHRRARLARLLARRPPATLPQRPAPRFPRERAVRRRRPRRRSGIPADPPLQRLDPGRDLAISRYASASRSASSACGRTASSSADGRPGSTGTALLTTGPTINSPARHASRNSEPATLPVTRNNSLTLAE